MAGPEVAAENNSAQAIYVALFWGHRRRWGRLGSCELPGSGGQLRFGETAEGGCFAALLFLLLLLLLPKLLSLLSPVAVALTRSLYLYLRGGLRNLGYLL